MAKKPDRDPTEPGHSEDAPGKNKPRADNELPGGGQGNTGLEPMPKDLLTAQEQIAADEAAAEAKSSKKDKAKKE